MYQRPIFRSYSELQAVIRKIEAEVHKYLPYYKVVLFSKVEHDEDGGIVEAICDDTEKVKTIFFWREFLERAPIERIMETTAHEIAHAFDYNPEVFVKDKKGRLKFVDEAQGHGMDWAHTSHVLGGDFLGMSYDEGFNSREKYIWKCVDCGKTVASPYKAKLPAEFISRCYSRRNPEGSSHLNFTVTDARNNRREFIHPLTSRRT